MGSRISRAIRVLLKRRFACVNPPPSFQQIQNAPEEFVVVAESRSTVIAALLESFLARASIPITTSYGAENAAARTLRWIGVNDSHALEEILAKNPAQRFVTLSIFERRGPIRTNPRHQISFFQLLEVVFLAHRLVIEFSTPLAPGDEKDLSENIRLVNRVQRKLKLEFFRNLKVVRGTPFQPIEIQEQIILSGQEFDREVELVATKLKVSRARVIKLASKEFRSVAANPIRPLYAIASGTCRIIMRKLFGQISTIGLERFVSVAKQHTVLLVPMHRSHFDYLLVGQQLYDSNINPPVVAAGINLSFWPIGFLVRSVGAYFVKRDSRGDRIHALVLRRYVTYLVRRGHLQEFFIEGGRSRSGRMRPPKVGLLSTVVDAFLKGLRKEIIFIPVAITYESVVEDRSFADENTGRKKRREDLFELLKVRSIFKNRYGDVVLRFGKPISLVSEIERFSQNKSIEPQDARIFTRELAQLLTTRIRLQTSVSLTGLVYSALLSAPRYGLSRGDLTDAVKDLAFIAELAGRLEPETGGATPTLKSFLEGNTQLLDDLLRRGVIHRKYALQREVFLIPGKQRFTADFYKNSLLHLFFPVALLSTLQSLENNFLIDDAESLHAIFSADLLLDPWPLFKSELSRWCELLVAEGILRTNESGQFSFVVSGRKIFNPYVLLAPIESILWSFQIIKGAWSGEEFAGDSIADSRTIPYAALLRQAQAEFRAAHYVGMTSRTEASSQSSLKSAFEILAHCGIIVVQEGSAKEIRLLKEQPAEIELLTRIKNAVTAQLS